MLAPFSPSKTVPLATLEVVVGLLQLPYALPVSVVRRFESLHLVLEPADGGVA